MNHILPDAPDSAEVIAEVVSAAPGLLHESVGVLGVALAEWQHRESARCPDLAREAANSALAEVERMTRRLDTLRSALAAEVADWDRRAER